MSSRHDYRRRDRSWERDDRDRYRERARDRDRGRYRDAPVPRRSRSRSPPRRGDRPKDRDVRDRDRRGPDRRDHGRNDRSERDRRDAKGRDDRDQRDVKDVREARREYIPKARETEREAARNRDKDARLPHEQDGPSEEKLAVGEPDARDSRSAPPGSEESPNSHSREDSTVPPEEGEEDEVMDATNDDDVAMMAMLGMSGFGSTKGKHVEGNQEGSVQIKKMRTWRQYMNRRGGFNRPLDKIK
ncbi:hypothetical protein BKA93DRAFT_514389 [Sparassis latifolia]|uniref:U4/U6.U5 small nuclear ribonucleoprotein 27kDa protein domain-containing protein n=1 Tax=Sparassis crispa TaxID=139825 RepID=A0A401GIG7_9APHY|nr:hypothetical protein SCP_0402970 [Sparassis crispa]GBE81923.1 hypothetical protein SCP_0402970 [Sparassis crispa]